MNTKMKKWIGVVFASAAAVVGIFLLVASYVEPPASARPAGETAAAAAGHGGAPAQAAAAVEARPGALNAWSELAASAQPVSPLSTMSPPVFAADSRGKLVLNADTHANLEKLLLEENPQAVLARLDQVSQILPPQAVAELKVLVGQFEQYSKALTHTIPPETAPETEPERLKLLDSLHALRVTYLGTEAAQAMFGEEEAMTRKLIRSMAEQKDPNMSSEQKAARAQESLGNGRRPPAG